MSEFVVGVEPRTYSYTTSSRHQSITLSLASLAKTPKAAKQVNEKDVNYKIW